MANRASVTTEEYGRKKKRVVREFIKSLKRETPKYDMYLESIPENLVPTIFPDLDRPTEAIFLLLSNSDYERSKKVKVLSEMLIDWVNGLRLKNKKKV